MVVKSGGGNNLPFSDMQHPSFKPLLETVDGFYLLGLLYILMEVLLFY
jgi:hypothetical protein